MSDAKRLARGFRLAEWMVKPEDGSLTSAETSIRLEPQLMDLLVFLCSRAGQVVPKQDVLDTIWGGRFVSDDTIKGSFYQLRKALGDNPREPHILETLPKRGYRILVSPVPIDTDSGLYGKGRAALASETNPAALKQARLYFEKFLESEPEHPGALAGLARTFIMMAALGFEGDLWRSAKTAASRAIELDPKLAEAHLVLAAVRAIFDHDLAAAIREFDAALELNPGDSITLRWRARVRSAQGSHDAAVADVRQAVDADPLSVPARRDLLEILFIARRYNNVAEEAARLFALAPSAADVHLGMVWVHCVQNQPRQAFDAFIAGLQSLGVAAAQIEQARGEFAREGMPRVLHLWASLLENEASIGQKTQNDLLVLYSLLAETDRSFRLIDASIERGNPFLLSLAESPVFDNLRADPRYEGCITRLGLKRTP
jgi:DNA-binding winged helix-turn-helix (wHTH) protein